MPYVISFLTLALMVFALINIITCREDQVKFLPKMVWIIIVILLPFVGSVLWFAIGREYEGSGIAMPRMPRAAQHTPTQTWQAPSTPSDGRTTEQQMADLDREIEEWRLREEIAKRKQERGEADTL